MMGIVLDLPVQPAQGLIEARVPQLVRDPYAAAIRLDPPDQLAEVVLELQVEASFDMVLEQRGQSKAGHHEGGTDRDRRRNQQADMQRMQPHVRGFSMM